MKYRTTRRLLIGALSFVLPLVLFLVIREKASWRPRVLGQHKGDISRIVWSPDGKQLVSCNNGANEIPSGTLYLWSVAERTYHVLPGRDNWHWSLQFLADGKITATNDEDFVRIYDAKKPTQPPKTIKVTGVWHVTPDGQALVGEKLYRYWTDSMPDTLVLRRIADGKETILKALRGTLLHGMAVSPDGQYFAAFTTKAPRHTKPTFWIWNIHAPDKPRMFKVRAETDSRLFFWPDNSSLAAVSESGTSLWVYNLKNGRFTYHRFTEPITAQVALSPTGDMLAYSGNGGIKILAYPSLKLVRELPHVYISSLQQPVAFSPDGSTLAVGDSKGIITLWRVR